MKPLAGHLTAETALNCELEAEFDEAMLAAKLVSMRLRSRVSKTPPNPFCSCGVPSRWHHVRLLARPLARPWRTPSAQGPVQRGCLCAKCEMSSCWYRHMRRHSYMKQDVPSNCLAVQLSVLKSRWSFFLYLSCLRL
jgi:hypothetical protein